MPGQRRKKKEPDFTYVALGIILGFFLGAGVVYWYSNRQTDSLLSYNLWNYIDNLFQANEREAVYSIPENAGNEPNQTVKKVSAQGGEELTGANNETVFFADSLLTEGYNEQRPDSLFTEPLETIDEKLALSQPIENIEENASEDNFTSLEPVRIVKDRLVSTRAFRHPEPLPPSFQSETTRTLDSLIGNLNRKTGLENMILVEFWLSPLNFRGYKLSHSKLILYGFEQPEALSLHSDGNTYFVKYFDNFYPVSHTLEFKPLVPLSDANLLEEFQQRWP